ncbi:MAG: DUF4160 domain-containing protein [Bryobacterales bacterium]|nr:DUF4160 domain-containing protein [Bryobacterales bacterium]MBV9396459.1 DUF4160 domain-containing protein [Bryobacterales bacterium]
MATISSFMGIVIRMYFRDHAPAHFHAIYGDAEIEVAIGSLKVLKGTMGRRALCLVLDWAEIHQPELLENWELARDHRPLNGIRPLE